MSGALSTPLDLNELLPKADIQSFHTPALTPLDALSCMERELQNISIAAPFYHLGINYFPSQRVLCFHF